MNHTVDEDTYLNFIAFNRASGIEMGEQELQAVCELYGCAIDLYSLDAEGAGVSMKKLNSSLTVPGQTSVLHVASHLQGTYFEPAIPIPTQEDNSAQIYSVLPPSNLSTPSQIN